MMGRQVGEAQLFYIFSVDRHVPADHLLRRVDSVLDLSFIRSSLAEHYSHTGRPSIDPELMIRMLLVGYLYGIRSETRLCEEVHLTWPIGGSAGLGWTVMCPSARPSPRTATAVSARAICSASCSKRSSVAA